MQLRFEPLVAPFAEPCIDPECRAQCDAVLDDGAIGADEEGQCAKEPGGDASQRATLRDRFARAIDPSGLERSQPAMDGLLMIERGAAAEVRRLDERRPEAAARGVVRDRQAVDAAADDEQVVLAGFQPVWVAWPHGRAFTL